MAALLATSQGVNYVSENSTVQKCLDAVGKLARAGIWFAAQLSAGPGLWLTLRSLPHCVVRENEYEAILYVLRAFPQQGRIVLEQVGSPGLRQLTLWEPVGESNRLQPAEDHSESLSPAFQWPTVNGCLLNQQRHPWQCDPRLPDRVTIDFSTDTPELLAAPPGWEMLRRYGRLLVRSLTGSTCQLDAAQAGMLELMQQGMNQSCFLEALVESCALQRRQVESRAVLWSRHLLSCIARISGARGLVGCTAVTFDPHF